MESKSYIKEQLLTTKIHINPSDIFNTKNIDGLIKFQLKQNIEGYCGKYGYILPNSLVVIKRSIGTILPNSNSITRRWDRLDRRGGRSTGLHNRGTVLGHARLTNTMMGLRLDRLIRP